MTITVTGTMALSVTQQIQWLASVCTYISARAMYTKISTKLLDSTTKKNYQPSGHTLQPYIK